MVIEKTRLFCGNARMYRTWKQSPFLVLQTMRLFTTSDCTLPPLEAFRQSILSKLELIKQKDICSRKSQG